MNKRTTLLLIGVVVIAAITVAVTVYSASLSGRWGAFKGLEEARAVLRSLPLEIPIPGTGGAWIAEGDRDLGNIAESMLQIQNSYIFRVYRNSLTQETVFLTLMVGPTGRVTVHTPDICFGGRDFEKEAERSRVEIEVELHSGDKVVDTFWRINFVGRSLDVDNRISFYYAVSTGSAWSAIEAPRWTFRTYRYVYRIQAEAFSGSSEDGDAVRRFLTDCLPTIHEHMHQCH